jgi:hypothetical protein
VVGIFVTMAVLVIWQFTIGALLTAYFYKAHKKSKFAPDETTERVLLRFDEDLEH